MESKQTSWESLEKYFTNYDTIQLHSQRYLHMLDFHVNQTPDNCKVLDAGSGTGILSKKLLEKGNKLISIDINENALSFLREKTKYNKNISISKADLSINFPIKEKVDIAHSMIVLPFPNNTTKYIQNIFNSLNENGKIVISAWNCVDDIYVGAIEKLEEELLVKKVLNKYSVNQTWNNIKKNGYSFAKEILKKNLTEHKLSILLKKIGFKNILIYDGIYNNKYTYHITAEK